MGPPAKATGSTRVMFTSRARRALASAAAAVMSRREGDPTNSTSRSWEQDDDGFVATVKARPHVAVAVNATAPAGQA